jgi:hypothetical protein
MVQEGSFQPNRYNDVLTTSIGTTEHPRRVREFGSAGVKAVYEKGLKRKISYAVCISKFEL